MENVDARRESASSEVLVPSSPAPCLPPSLFGVFTKLVGGHQRETLIFSILGDRLNQPLSPCLLFLYACYQYFETLCHILWSMVGEVERAPGDRAVLPPVSQAREHQGPREWRDLAKFAQVVRDRAGSNPSSWAVWCPALPQSSDLGTKTS